MSSDLTDSRARQLIDDLRAVSSKIDLPQIAVFGDTSAGKSSILSALSLVEFPSNVTLCTRCPIELRLTESTSFSGHVSLQVPGESLTQTKVINNPEEIPGLIASFMANITSNLEKQAISDTSVVLEVCGPHYPNLTLIDLPGLIQYEVEDGEGKQKHMVDEMVMRYMNQQRTVIVPILCASQDLHNQKILQFVRKADPDGLRTLAVLSKPDMVEAGSENTLKDIMLNKTVPLRLGYSSVKCRDKVQRSDNVTIEQMAIDEMKFFKSTAPWKDLDINKLGASNLRKILSTHLSERIREQLPNLTSEVDKKLEEYTKKYENLGPNLVTCYEQRNYFDKIVRHSTKLIKESTENCSDDVFFDVKENHWRSDSVVKMTKFRDDIAKLTSEATRITVDKDMFVEGQYRPVTYVGSNQEDCYRAELKLREPNPKATCSVADYPLCENNSTTVYKFSALSSFRTILLYEVYTEYALSRGPELPSFPSYNAFVKIWNKHVLSKWRKPCIDLLEKILNAGQQVVNSALKHTCSRPALYDFLDEKSKSIMESMNKEAYQSINNLLEKESRPSTQDPCFMENLQKMRLERITNTIQDMKDENGNVNKAAVIALLEKTSTRPNEIIVAEDIVFTLSAYAKVARKRFVDSFDQEINTILTSMSDKLRNGWCATDHELAEILSEPMYLKEQRDRLEKDLKGFQQAKQKISDFRTHRY